MNFIWNGKMFVAFGKTKNPATSQIEVLIAEGYYEKDGVPYNLASHEPCKDADGHFYETADEALEYLIDGVRLHDIITKVKVTDRTI